MEPAWVVVDQGVRWGSGVEREAGLHWGEPLSETKAKNDENPSLAALNVKNGTRVLAAQCPESLKLLHLNQ